VLKLGHKKISSFKDANKYLKYRQDKVKNSLSLAWDDSWATDKTWLKELDGLFPCKFCAKKMHAFHYSQGEIIMTCDTPLCPGNIDSGMAGKIKQHQFDIRELTNRYLFNSILRF